LKRSNRALNLSRVRGLQSLGEVSGTEGSKKKGGKTRTLRREPKGEWRVYERLLGDSESLSKLMRGFGETQPKQPPCSDLRPRRSALPRRCVREERRGGGEGEWGQVTPKRSPFFTKTPGGVWASDFLKGIEKTSDLGGGGNLPEVWAGERREKSTKQPAKSDPSRAFPKQILYSGGGDNCHQKGGGGSQPRTPFRENPPTPGGVTSKASRGGFMSEAAEEKKGHARSRNGRSNNSTSQTWLGGAKKGRENSIDGEFTKIRNLV